MFHWTKIKINAIIELGRLSYWLSARHWLDWQWQQMKCSVCWWLITDYACCTDGLWCWIVVTTNTTMTSMPSTLRHTSGLNWTSPAFHQVHDQVLVSSAVFTDLEVILCSVAWSEQLCIVENELCVVRDFNADNKVRLNNASDCQAKGLLSDYIGWTNGLSG